MAGEAWAETVCAGAQDLTALQVASVQQELMVAALSCEVDDVTLYNSFVTVYQQELVTSDEALQAYFLRRAPGTGTDDYNSFKTKLANNFSSSSGGDRPSFCRRADRLFHDALAGRKKSLAAFVLAQPMIVDAGYTVCGAHREGRILCRCGSKGRAERRKTGSRRTRAGRRAATGNGTAGPRRCARARGCEYA